MTTSYPFRRISAIFVLSMVLCSMPFALERPGSVGQEALDPSTLSAVWKYTRNESEATFWKLAWSPDGSLIAATFFDGTCVVLSSADGSVTRVIDLNLPATRCDGYSPEGTLPLRACAFSPDGKYLALGGDDTRVPVFDTSTWERKWTFIGHTGSVLCLDFSPDSRYLASGSGTDKVIPQNAGENVTRIWDMTTGRQVLALPAHRDGVLSVKWSHAGDRLATASDDRTVKVWSFPEGDELAVCKGHTSGVLDVVWTPDDLDLLSGSRDYKIKVWNSSSGALLSTWSDYNCVRSVDVHPGGELAATSCVDLTLKIRDIRTGTELKVIKDGMEQNAMVMCSRWSPDGRTLASGLGKSHTVMLYGFGGAPERVDQGWSGALTLSLMAVLAVVFIALLFYPALQRIRRERR